MSDNKTVIVGDGSGGGSGAAIAAIVVILLLVIAAWYFFAGPGAGTQANQSRTDINVNVPSIQAPKPS